MQYAPFLYPKTGEKERFIMAERRKDNKNRVLKEGESQRKDGT